MRSGSRDPMFIMATIVIKLIVHLKFAARVDLKCSHSKKKKERKKQKRNSNYMMDVLISLTVITSQCIHKSNHHVIHP